MPAPPWLLRLALPLFRVAVGYRGLSVGVRILVRNEAGEILLVRHTYRGGWYLPGGGVEVGETAQEAAIRELAEEAGVHATGPLRLIGCFHNHRWRRGDHTLLYEAPTWTAGPSKWAGEIAEVRFHAPDALPADVNRSVRLRLAEAQGAPVSPRWEGDD